MESPSVQARTHTHHLALETRQHEFLGIDLGEGPPRRTLVFGVVVGVVWVLLLVWILGAPTKWTFILYTTPPVLLTYYGTQWAPNMPRRRRYTVWALAIRQLMKGHRPIIGLGMRQPKRSEYLPLRVRRDLPTIGEIVKPWTRRNEWDRTDNELVGASDGKPVTLRPRVTLYGNREMYARLQKMKGKGSDV